MTKKRYAQVGVGDRSFMYSFAVAEQYRDTSELVALCDNNLGRLRTRADWAAGRDLEVPVYLDTEFDRMIAETKPDTVIVTSKDATHDQYICRAMELGCDVITEKPMTTDEHKAQRIIDTQKRTGRKCTVTFNYRYSPPRTQMKDLLMSGIIGNIVSVDFHWVLDTRHGADYFRRWHRNKANSGGLLVHKATHHFDLINWWLSDVPERVYAEGARNFYRPETAERYGFTQRGERCLDCPESEKCPFYLDLRAYPRLVETYLNNEQFDGYFRDRCVFSGDIDIEDTMHLAVRYRGGATMSYSLHAFMPWEGYTGRDHRDEGADRARGAGDGLHQRRRHGARRAQAGRDPHPHLPALPVALRGGYLDRPAAGTAGPIRSCSASCSAARACRTSICARPISVAGHGPS